MTRRASKLQWAAASVMALTTHCNSTSAIALDAGVPLDASSSIDAPIAAGDSATPVDASGSDAGGDAAPFACNFAAGVDGGLQTFAPNDPNITYVGRTDLVSAAPRGRYYASAEYVTANFLGSAVSVKVYDQGINGAGNLFEAIVDSYPPVRLVATLPAQHIFPINVVDDAGAAVTLPCSQHKVTLVKRTEPDYGYTDFGGFEFAQIMPPDPPAAHKIEIIGDSITCGAGVESKTATDPACSLTFGEGLENGYLSYGPDLARMLKADWHVTCSSGIGLVRDYFSKGDLRTMPQIYPLLNPETLSDTTPDTTEWSASGGKAVAGAPDAIVIGLGTNDFSRDGHSSDGGSYRDPMVVGSLDAGLGSVDGGETLEQGYVLFIDQLKGYYPGVSIFLVSSPILGDGYPTPSDMQLSQHAQAIKDVAAYYAADPTVHVYPVILSKVVSPTGCGGHPGVAQQAAAATTIAAAMRSALGW